MFRLLGGRGPLLAALVLGSLTSFLVWRYVDGVGQTVQPVQTTPVIVAATAIPARTVVTADMLQVQQIPVAARHPSALTSTREVVGKVSRSALTPGEQVLNTKLFLQREDSGLAFMIPDGLRAISVGFTEVIGTGGLLVPGDRVDVVGVFEVRRPTRAPNAPNAPNTPGAPGAPSLSPYPYLESGSDQDTYFVSTMVLQDVQVLAVAQRLEGEDTRDTGARVTQSAGIGAAAVGAGGSGAQAAVRSQPQPQPQAKTATLAVSPEDSLRLVLAEEKGKIRLALRPTQDTSVFTPGSGSGRPGSIVQVAAPSRGQQ